MARLIMWRLTGGTPQRGLGTQIRSWSIEARRDRASTVWTIGDHIAMPLIKASTHVEVLLTILVIFHPADSQNWVTRSPERVTDS